MAKQSAGLLMYRRGAGDAPEVFLVHPGGPFWKNKDLGAWSIPKGEFGPDESAEQAAVREFVEETGLQPAGDLIGLGDARQPGADRCPQVQQPCQRAPDCRLNGCIRR